MFDINKDPMVVEARLNQDILRQSSLQAVGCEKSVIFHCSWIGGALMVCPRLWGGHACLCDLKRISHPARLKHIEIEIVSVSSVTPRI